MEDIKNIETNNKGNEVQEAISKKYKYSRGEKRFWLVVLFCVVIASLTTWVVMENFVYYKSDNLTINTVDGRYHEYINDKRHKISTKKVFGKLYVKVVDNYGDKDIDKYYIRHIVSIEQW